MIKPVCSLESISADPPRSIIYHLQLALQMEPITTQGLDGVQHFFQLNTVRSSI